MKKGLFVARSDSMLRTISLCLPRLGLSALMICLVSGVIMAFYYRPMGNAFQNVEEITTVVPYGWFFRQLHYGAGQAFVILMLIHTLDHFLQKRYRKYALGEWMSLVGSLALCFYTLFTGFILKGDQEGVFAGRIFVNLLETLPIFGKTIAPLFMDTGDGFFFIPYLYHCFFLPLLIVYMMRGHIREWLPDEPFLLSGGIAISLFALLVKPGVGIPPDVPSAVVEGPWFFQGIQTLLKLLPPLMAALILPGLFVGCLLLIPLFSATLRAASFKGRILLMWEIGLYWLLIISGCSYVMLTIRAFVWGP